MTLDRARFCLFAVMSVTGDAGKLSKSAEFYVNSDDTHVYWNTIRLSTFYLRMPRC